MTQVVAKKQKNKKVVKRILIGGGIAIVSAFALYVFRLKSWYDALTIDFKAKISGYSNGSVILKCTVPMSNPKNFALTITKPTIRIYNGTAVLASSIPSKEKVTIAANEVTTLYYTLTVPVTGELTKLILNAGYGVIGYIQSLIAGESTAFNLGVKLQAVAYMQIAGMERTWKQDITI